MSAGDDGAVAVVCAGVEMLLRAAADANRAAELAIVDADVVVLADAVDTIEVNPADVAVSLGVDAAGTTASVMLDIVLVCVVVDAGAGAAGVAATNFCASLIRTDVLGDAFPASFSMLACAAAVSELLRSMDATRVTNKRTELFIESL